MGDALSACVNANEEQEDQETFADRYDVGEKLGSGNYGEVRSCWPRGQADKKAQDLAVKILDRQSPTVKAAEAYQSAEHELEIMGQLQHPHIVELVEFFEETRFLYVVMERIGGGELMKALAMKGAVVIEDDISHVGLQLLQALEYLHGVNVVHRDVKAANILLTDRPQAGRALQNAAIKLIDFGLAARLKQECLNASEAQLDLVCGTPAMCAPEIWASQDTAPKTWKRHWGNSYGPKVDVWAAGVVLYMSLLGRLPFMEKHIRKLAEKICDPFEEPSFDSVQKGHQVSPGCRKFLASLLQKDQHKRVSAAKACHDSWLAEPIPGGKRSRGLKLTPIPAEVREAALREAEAALQEWLPPEGLNSGVEAVPAVSAQEAAERSRAFEAAWAEAVASRAAERPVDEDVTDEEGHEPGRC